MQSINRNANRGFVGLVILGVIAALAIFFVTQYFHYANRGAVVENLLVTKRDDNKNVMATFSNKIVEIAQAAKMTYKAQADLIKAANEARYSKEGSKATVQMFQEQNPTADPALARKLQDVIDIERTRYENAQREMLDIRNTFKTELAMPYSGFWLRLAGYPHINFADFDVIVNNYTENAYQTKKAEAINFQ